MTSESGRLRTKGVIKKVGLWPSMAASFLALSLAGTGVLANPVEGVDNETLEWMKGLRDQAESLNETDLSHEDKRLIRKAQDRIFNSASGASSNSDAGAIEWEQAFNSADPANKNESSPHADILVSESMGESELRLALEAAATCTANTNIPVRLVFRGIQEDDSLGTFGRRQGAYLGVLEGYAEGARPGLIIDIESFERFAPKGRVPVLVQYKPDGSTVRRPGVIDPCFDPDDPILGQASSMVSASEVPMLKLIKDRANQINWEGKKAKAGKRYFSRLPDPQLQVATSARTRKMNMGIRVKHDMFLPDGTLLAKAGEVLNPLDAAPLSGHYLIINPRLDAQVAFTREYLESNPGKDVVIILDGAPVEKTPKSLHELENVLGSEFFMLNDSVKDRFNITRTPSVIKQHDAENIQVSEVFINESLD